MRPWRLFVAVLTLLIACLAAAASASAAGWISQSVPAPHDPNGELAGVSCTAEGDCVAVGSLLDRWGGRVPLAMRWDGSNWTAQYPPAPSENAMTALTSVSCVSADWCVAVGWTAESYTHGGSPFIEIWDGSSWTMQSTPDSGGYPIDLDSVSCTSKTACMAVGGWLAAVAVRWDGQSWSIDKLNGDNQLYGVSCVSATDCFAVGDTFVSGGGNQPVTEHWNGSGWTAEDPPHPWNGYTLNSVSCTSSDACTAVGGYAPLNGAVGAGAPYSTPFAVRWDGTAWNLQSTPAFSGTIAGLTSVSCTSLTACTAVGVRGESQSSLPVAMSWDGASWSLEQPSAGPLPSASLVAVSCDSATACLAVGSDWLSTSYPLAETRSAGQWTNASLPDTDGGQSDPLSSVSCASQSMCLAVGAGAYNGASPSVEDWNGTSWTVRYAAVPAGASRTNLAAVACPASNECMAVGSWGSQTPGSGAQLAERWDGTSWTIESTPPPSGGTESSLQAISCPTSTWCMAVGSTVVSGATGPLASTWDGSAWSSAEPPVPAGTYTAGLRSVSCTSAVSCTAVGYANQAPLAEHWDGVSWTIEQTAVPTAILTSISCVNTGCEVVGFRTGGQNELAVAELDSAGTWTEQSPPSDPVTGQGPTLESVSCTSSTACIAVGSDMAERWDGSSWTLELPLFPDGLGIGSFYSVSCWAQDACIAAGNQKGLIQAPRADVYSGSAVAPTATAPPTISGKPVSQHNLTEQHGSWTNNPTAYYYQWQQCDTQGDNCVNLPGANNPSYWLAESDVGHTVRVKEWASDAGTLSAPAVSGPSPVIQEASRPQNTSPPSITGTPAEGNTLSEQHGQWTNDPTGYSYQWLDCDTYGANCTSIQGATESTYTLTGTDVGHTITVEEFASNETGTAEATSPPTQVVTASSPTAPTATPSATTRAAGGGTPKTNPTGAPSTAKQAIRTTMAQWVRDLFAGSPAGCSLLDNAARETFVRQARKTLRATLANCRAAIRAWGRLLHALRRSLPRELNLIAHARVSLQGHHAHLSDPETRAAFTYNAHRHRWLIDRLQ